MLMRFRECIAERERGVAHRAKRDDEAPPKWSFDRATSGAKGPPVGGFAREIAHALACHDVDEMGLHDGPPAKNR